MLPDTFLHRLATWLHVLGALGGFGAYLWWFDLYGDTPSALGCLYSMGDWCRLLTVGVQLRGGLPYTPIVFWGSLLVLGTSWVLFFCTRQTRP